MSLMMSLLMSLRMSLLMSLMVGCGKRPDSSANRGPDKKEHSQQAGDPDYNDYLQRSLLRSLMDNDHNKEFESGLVVKIL